MPARERPRSDDGVFSKGRLEKACALSGHFLCGSGRNVQEGALSLSAALRPATAGLFAGREALPSAPDAMEQWLLIPLGLVLPRPARLNL